MKMEKEIKNNLKTVKCSECGWVGKESELITNPKKDGAYAPPQCPQCKSSKVWVGVSDNLKQTRAEFTDEAKKIFDSWKEKVFSEDNDELVGILENRFINVLFELETLHLKLMAKQDKEAAECMSGIIQAYETPPVDPKHTKKP